MWGALSMSPLDSAYTVAPNNSLLFVCSTDYTPYFWHFSLALANTIDQLIIRSAWPGSMSLLADFEFHVDKLNA